MHRIRWAVLGTLALTALARCETAPAHELTPAECAVLAKDAWNLARNRDLGVESKAATWRMQVDVDRLYGKPGSYLRDEGDVEMVFALLARVYEDDRPPSAIAGLLELGCTSRWERRLGSPP